MGRQYSAGPQASRLAWYDRNAKGKNDGIAVTAAPHTITTRISYTTPAGKKVYLDQFLLRIRINTAATTAGNKEARWEYQPSGGSALTVMCVELRASQNVVDTLEKEIAYPSFTMYPADVLQGRTFDTGTGGDIEYRLYYKLTEFDA